MSHISTIYNQLLQLIPRHEFAKLVKKHKNDCYVKYFSSWQQLITMLFAQIKRKDSLRDIVTSLKAQASRWYHIGLKDVKRSTLSDANNKRDYRVFEELFYSLLAKCESRAPRHKFRFNSPLYSMDATLIDLCLNIFPWAKFRKRKGAIKLHYLYNHSGSLPAFIVVTDAKQHEITVVKKQQLPILADSIISVDRAYIDYEWLNSLDKKKVFFVTRAKKNMKYELIGQQEVNNKKGLLYDKIVKLTGFMQSQKYPKQLRLVGYRDPETNKIYTFLTNNFKLAAFTITQIYKSRWQIELFFKWIKQNLKIKSFLGTSRNAVLTQIWIAMCCYLLLSYIKFQTRYSFSLQDLARMFAEMLFERLSIIDLLSCKSYNTNKIRSPDSQLTLF